MLSQVCKKQLNLQVKFLKEVVRFHVDFRPQHHEFVQFDLLLAEPDQERLRAVCLVVYLGRTETMLI